MNSFTLMWSKMLDSSVWQTTKEARLLWVTMLLMKDKNGVVRAAVPGLAHRAVLTLGECEEALRILEGPDPYSTTPTEGGRRVIPVPGGWQIVNHELYRCSDEARKEQARLRQARHRQKRGGETLREKVNREVAADPLTKQDAKELRRIKRNGKSASRKVALEYDIEETAPGEVPAQADTPGNHPAAG